MPPKTNTIWMDGQYVPWDEAQVHVLALGLHYGTSVFEGIRAYKTKHGPAVFRLREHLRRLFRSATFLQMPIPFGLERLEEVCLRLVAENGLEDCYLRPLAFYGVGSMNFSFRGNTVHVAVAVWPWGAYLGDEGMRRGIRMKTVTWIKTPTTSLPSAVKLAGNYVNSCLAYQEAMRAGFDEALMFNDRGMIAEGSGENVFAVNGEALLTPPASDHVLPGVTRDSVMRIAHDLGYEVREASLTLPELLAADEVFLTGTAAEVTPVREIDYHPIAAGRAGPVTLDIQRAFFAAAHGSSPAYRDWLTYVREPVSARAGELRQVSDSVSANAK